MQIIIPMSGYGERFRKAGYKVPKPLIEVEGKPIIAHVINLFPGENNFTFICSQDHLETTNMRVILEKYCPSGEIIGIESHKKGPVFAVSQIFEKINLDEPVIVNYCDFNCLWDYENFKLWSKKNNLDGAIPAYKGFHPHSLGKTNYAYIRESNMQLLEIKEKEPFTDNRMEEYASTGTYFFSKGTYLINYFKKVLENNVNVNGEYYCSLVYNFMIKDRLKIGIYEIDHFMQWGTPDDLEEYLSWSKLFDSLSNKKSYNNALLGTTIIPMAGKGSRFKEKGYKKDKPYIEVNKKCMFIEATKSLPKSNDYLFIKLRSNNCNSFDDKQLEFFRNFEFIEIDETPKGQAVSTSIGIKKIEHNNSINISACDHAVIYDEKKFMKIYSSGDFDLIVWTVKGHYSAIRNPNMYGWLSVQDGEIKETSIKKPLNDTKRDPIIIGTFTFKNKKIFIDCFERLKLRNNLVNDEYYVDSMIQEAIELGYKCKVFDVQHYICWGTPDELRTYNYWSSCFDKLKNHNFNYLNYIKN